VTQDDDTSRPDDLVEVARVIDAWGIKGAFRVQTYAADPEAVFSSRRWYIEPPEGKPARRDGPPLPSLLKITQAREHGEGVVASAQEVADRNAAEALKGARIFVSRSSFPTAREGEYYWIDLIGLDVVNRQGESLGTVADLLDTGPHSVLRLRYPSTDDKGQLVDGERLIPFVAAYVDAVEIASKRIVVDWGLDY
jgi:16S rRNA processing protein RimM